MAVAFRTDKSPSKKNRKVIVPRTDKSVEHKLGWLTQSCKYCIHQRERELLFSLHPLILGVLQEQRLETTTLTFYSNYLGKDDVYSIFSQRGLMPLTAWNTMRYPRLYQWQKPCDQKLTEVNKLINIFAYIYYIYFLFFSKIVHAYV